MLCLMLPLFILITYFYLTKNHGYWKKRNVKHDRPLPIFGNIYQNVMFKKSFTQLVTELYNKYPNQNVVGLYSGTTSELILRDLELIRKIMNEDFAYFYPRGIGRNPKKEPLHANLIHVDGDSWKLLRHRLTSAFTAAKIKNMFPLVIECAEKLQEVGKDIVNNGGECDVRDLMARFTTDFITACGFGLQTDSINNDSSLIRNLGREVFKENRSWKFIANVALCRLFPDFSSLIQSLLSETKLFDAIKIILETVLTQRNNKPSDRHDFIDLLMRLRDEGKITGQSIEKQNPDGSPMQVEMEMDLKCMVAQVFIFFVAGFETSSSATSYLLHELAFHPEIQIKIQKEIDQVLDKYDNKLCYDAITEMTYLSMAFKEAMRKFPAVGTLHRVCAKQYTISDLGITLDPGVKIIIPVHAIHNDEKYFNNPSQFKPERFAETSEPITKYSYLPFGEGPRKCMGGRLGEMQSLAGLVAVLQKFTFEPGISSKRDVKVSAMHNIVQGIEGGLPLKLRLRHKNTTSAY